MSQKSYNCLQKEFLHEIDFVSNIGRKLFVYPFIGRNKISVYCYIVVYLLVVITSSQLFISLCLTNFQDWFQIVNIAPNFGVCLMILIKFKKFHNHNLIYDKILRHFKFDLWDIFKDCDEYKLILKTYTDTTRWIFRLEFYYTITLVVIVNLLPRVIMWYQVSINSEDIQYLYPFDGWYPFDKVKWYYIAYSWEGFMTAIVIFIYAFANMIHLMYTRFICMELKLLSKMMEGLISLEDVAEIQNSFRIWTYDPWNTALLRRNKLAGTYKFVKTKLVIIIRRHQLLAEITTDLNKVLGDGMLLIYVFGSVFMCLTIFTAIVVENFYLRIRYFFFFCSLIVEVFFQCIIGQLLINHSLILERAIYFADWPHANAEIRKMLLILLIRAQKPLQLSAKGFVVMNLGTFSSICSLSYQFFNLLRTAYS